MGVKPENRFIRTVHERLASTYYHKSNNPYRHGEADCFYSGTEGLLWVEYKRIAFNPERSTKHIPLDLMTLPQKAWLYDRFREGHSIAVIVGLKEGTHGLVFPQDAWVHPHPEPLRMSLDEIATFIHNIAGDSPCRSSSSYPVFLAS